MDPIMVFRVDGPYNGVPCYSENRLIESVALRVCRFPAAPVVVSNSAAAN